MLWTLVVILMVLWALGMLTGVALEGFIHVLLLVAVVVVIVNLLTGRRTT